MSKHWPTITAIVSVVVYGLIGLMVFAILIEESALSIPDDNGGWVYAYQTLITGLIALLVGWLSIRAIKAQINEQRRGRLERRVAAAKAYRAAAEDYFESVNTVIRLVNKRNRLDDENPTSGRSAFIDIHPNEWDAMPKVFPEILTDWYYLSEVPSDNVQHMLEIRRSLNLIKRCLETLKIYNRQDHLEALHVEWDNLVSTVCEEHRKIKDILDVVYLKNSVLV